MNSPKILHLQTTNNKNFSFRNPIIYEESSDINIRIETIVGPDCPDKSSDLNFSIRKYPTGILMNNQMNNFAYQYGNESIKGRAASPGNKYAPGKRPMSTMAPTIVFDENDKLLLITGSPGGKLIPAAILRLLTGVIDFNLNIGSATMLPRISTD